MAIASVYKFSRIESGLRAVYSATNIRLTEVEKRLVSAERAGRRDILPRNVIPEIKAALAAGNRALHDADTSHDPVDGAEYAVDSLQAIDCAERLLDDPDVHGYPYKYGAPTHFDFLGERTRSNGVGLRKALLAVQNSRNKTLARADGPDYLPRPACKALRTDCALIARGLSAWGDPSLLLGLPRVEIDHLDRLSRTANDRLDPLTWNTPGIPTLLSPVPPGDVDAELRRQLMRWIT